METNIAIIANVKVILQETVQSQIEEEENLMNIIEEKRRGCKKVDEAGVVHTQGAARPQEVAVDLVVIVGHVVEVVDVGEGVETRVEAVLEKEAEGRGADGIADVQIVGIEGDQEAEIGIEGGPLEVENVEEIDREVKEE